MSSRGPVMHVGNVRHPTSLLPLASRKAALPHTNAQRQPPSSKTSSEGHPSFLFRRLCRSEISLLALYLQVNNSWHVGHVCTTLTVKRAEINMPNLITYRKSYLALSTCLRSRSVLKYLESSGLIIWGYYTYIGIIHFDFRKMVLLS